MAFLDVVDVRSVATHPRGHVDLVALGAGRVHQAGAIAAATRRVSRVPRPLSATLIDPSVWTMGSSPLRRRCPSLLARRSVT